MRGGVVVLVLVSGCVGDAVVVRRLADAASSDAATADAPAVDVVAQDVAVTDASVIDAAADGPADVGTDGAADAAVDVAADASLPLALRIYVTATGVENVNSPSAFSAVVRVTTTRGDRLVNVHTALEHEGVPVPWTVEGVGQTTAAVGDYDGTLNLTVPGDDGVDHLLPLSRVPVFSFTAPRNHDRVQRSLPLSIAWSPFGGAVTTLILPEPPRVVPDLGSAVIAAGSFGPELVEWRIRLQRETSLPIVGFAPESTLTVAVVNSVEISLE